MTRWLVTFLLLACGCGEALAAPAGGWAAYSCAASAQQDGELRPSNTKAEFRGGARSQERQDQAKDKAQTSELQITNPFEVMKLASEALALAQRPTRESAIEALKRYKALYAFYKSLDMKIGMASSLYACGAAYYFLGRMHEAVDAFNKASDYSRESAFDFLRPLIDPALGAAYASLGETSKALETLNRALPTVRLMGNASMLALTLRGLGEINVYMGQKRKALEYLTEAVSLYRETEDWQFEVQVLPLISALRSSLGQSTEAMNSALAAVSRAKEKGSSDWEAYGYFAVGAAYASAGNLDEAAAAYSRSLQLLRGKNDNSGEATAFNNLGLIYVARGDVDRAMDYFQKALKLYKSSDNPEMAGYVSQNIGAIYYQRGEPLNALRHFEEALAIASRSNDRRLKAAILTNMADAYFSIDSRDYALNLLKENAAIFREIEEPAHETESLISLADGYGALGRYRAALDALGPVLESWHIAQDPARHGYVLREMGYIYNLMGERDKALKHFEEALSRLEAAGDAFGQVDLYGVWGAAYILDGDNQRAEEMFTKGLALARKAGLRRSEMLILAGLGALNEKQGNLARAEDFYDQEIAAGESLRSSARIEELKTGVGSISAPLLAPAALLKFKLGKWGEAFELVERARARTFLDQMNGARIDIRKGSDPGLMAQEQSLRFDIRSLEEKLRTERRNNPSSEAVGLMGASLKEKEEAYAALLVRLKASNPEYAQLRSYSPVPMEKIQQLLGPQTTMVSYFVTADRTLAFVVGSDYLHVVEIPVKMADLQAAIEWFRGFASLDDSQPQSLKQLYDWLIAPIRPYIKTVRVIIVPYGLLHYVPFAALTDGREYFSDEHTIYYLPGASILPSLRGRIGR
ncbi:MAG TPA: tetratricopeptide repeat protein, partial [Blastocatellia bacterium]|nr:tetratricopeptide repeat protein [Blastocatellia bacterium]